MPPYFFPVGNVNTFGTITKNLATLLYFFSVIGYHDYLAKLISTSRRHHIVPRSKKATSTLLKYIY